MKKLPVFIVCFLIAGQLYAQFDAQFSQYWAIENYFNPAKAGTERNKAHLTALHKMQWLGMPGAPRSTFIAGEAAIDFLGKTHGVGASFFNEKIGLFSISTVSAQYAYKLKLFSGTLSLGLEGGLCTLSFDGSSLYTPSGSDYHNPSDAGIPQSEVSGRKLNVNFGMRYSTEYWYAGLSSTRLTEPSFDFNETASTYTGRIYYLTAGGNIQLSNPLYQFQPSFLVKSDLLLTQIDATVRLLYNDFIWGGLSYRWKEALIFVIGLNFKNIKAGYSYDYSTTRLAKISSGSHEITLSYVMDLNFSKNNKYKYKSIRIL
ncbi:MAG: type IX secretion system membrane protein PorP/SprF [Bacteroidales bacterium]|jgi:type IX secretion system PorP/SprF family membrane protein|nr:type IX secretion system membrane protein PorP/SprF [Bacteroidales bacterium]